MESLSDDARLAGVDPDSRRDVLIKKLLYPAHTIPTAAAPTLVGVGLALHDGVFSPLPALAVFVFGWLVQLGGVLADNYFNLLRYRNDREHPALVHALETDLISLDEIKGATVLAFGIAAVVAVYMVLVGGVPVVIVGIASMVVSLFYSLEVTDVPLHDLYFFVFFGPISVGGTYYLQAVSTTASETVPLWLPPGSLPAIAVVAGIPVGALTAAILVVDNIRDLEYDRDKDDPTLAVVIGERWSRIQYNALLVLAYAVPVAVWLVSSRGPTVLLPLGSSPAAVLVARRMAQSRTYRELLPLSPRTGQLLLAFSVLWTVGFAL